MQEQILAPEHPALAITLEHYAALLIATHREGEAMNIVERAKEIRERHAKESAREPEISQEDRQQEGSVI
jgi:hypothetical protein